MNGPLGRGGGELARVGVEGGSWGDYMTSLRMEFHVIVGENQIMAGWSLVFIATDGLGKLPSIVDRGGH